MKPYFFDIYHELNDDIFYRYTLGRKGSNPLIAIGLNPSKANKNRTDMTISKIMGFAEKNGFDGFIMLNLYPQRTTDPQDLHEDIDYVVHSTNVKAIVDCLSQFKELNILAVWGEPIKKKMYLTSCLKEINAAISHKQVNWMQIGTMTKSGHPRHPSRAAYSLGINTLHINDYLASLNN